MSTHEWKLIQQQVEKAAQLEGLERHRYLDEHCPDQIRDRVLEILASSSESTDDVDRGFPGIVSPWNEPIPRIEGYTILKTLGRGGMGTVYLAEQNRPYRLVALKMMQWGWDTKERSDRFRAEIQALALLDHPGIAQLYDSGMTTDNRPWFTMAYCDGQTIDEYVSKMELSLRSVLELFGQLCQAISHAHLNLVIHRDLKPSNVMVVDTTEGPRVTVIDFGIGKALDPMIPADTHTRQAFGTPGFQAPEAIGESSPRDTRGDVFALGAIFYHLIAGQAPFAFDGVRSRSSEEIILAVKQEDPPQMSRLTRFSKKLVRGDLDAIAAKALQKDAAQRYQSVDQFAQDVVAYLEDRPIMAQPPSGFMALRKFVRRHKVVVAAGAAVLMTLILASAFSFNRMRDAEAARAEADAARAVAERQSQLAAENAQKARQEATEAEAVLKALKDILIAPDPFAKPERDILKIIDQAGQKVRRLAETNPEAAFEIYCVLISVHLNYSDLARAENCIDASIYLLERFLGANTSMWAEIYYFKGLISLAKMEYPDAECWLRLALDVTAPGTAKSGRVKLKLARAVRKQGRAAQSEAILQSIDQYSSGVDEWELSYEKGMVLLESDEVDLSLEHFWRLVEKSINQFGERHPKTLSAQNAYALTLEQAGQLEEAICIRRNVADGHFEVLGDHPRSVEVTRNLINLLRLAGRSEEAVARGRWIAKQSDHELHDQQKLLVLNDISLAFIALGKNTAAMELLERAYRIRIRMDGPDHPETLRLGHNLGNTARELKRFDLATSYLQSTLEQREHVLGVNNPQTILTVFTLGETYLDKGNLKMAGQYFDRATESMTKLQPLSDLTKVMEAYRDVVRNLLGSQEPIFAVGRLNQLPQEHRIKLEALIPEPNQ